MFTITRLLLVVALGIATSTPVIADTYPRQPGVDARHYIFRMTLLTGETNEIQAEATATFRLLSATVREIVLDLATPSADGRGMTVGRVTRAGQPVAFTHRDDRLQLPVPSGAKAGDDVTFTIGYTGVPARGLLLADNIHGDRTAFSVNWHNRARQWLPMIDHPADKATGEWIITTKAEYQVIGNGALVEETDLPSGLRRTHWTQAAPISSWLYALGVARFAVRHAGVVRGVPLEYWVFPQDATKGFALFEQDARGSFEFFSDRVGPYAYDKLAHVQAAGMGGGMEHATNIFYGEKGIASGSGPVVHETAHQWFGNAVTESDWNDVWLSEGFATYFTLLYTEHASGRDAVVAGLRRSRDTVVGLEKSRPNTPVVHVDLNEASQSPNSAFSYQKGSWALHMLRNVVGTETFWQGIREYYRRHVNGTASTDDLRRAMEYVSGQDLAWFFRQWLNRSGVPAVTGTWSYDAGAKQVTLRVSQSQEGEPFRFSLGIGLVGAGGAPPRVLMMPVSGRETTATFSVDAEPVSVVLDPDVTLLADLGAFTRGPA